MRVYAFVVALCISAMVFGASSHASAQAKQKTITINKGETLSQIAKREGVSTAALKSANRQIKNVNRIYTGQRLQLPAKKIAGKSRKTKAIKAAPKKRLKPSRK